MAELSTLARPYARAAFEYARDRGELAQWSQQLALAAAVTRQQAMAAVLTSPSLTAQQQAQTLGEVFPLTHFLRAIRAVMLKGAGPQDIATPFAVLLVFVLVYSLLALLRFRRTLD